MRQDLYDKAVAVVREDKRANISYLQRKLQIGFSQAAAIVARMEKEGIVSPANHIGKREVLS